MSSLRPLLQTSEDGHLPFLCLQYHDNAGTKHLVPAVYLGDVSSMDGSKLKNMVCDLAFVFIALNLLLKVHYKYHIALPHTGS